MSRWTDIFNSHPFKQLWSELKIAVSEQRIDDQTVITSVAELARLKKIIAYLDEMLNSIDPELIPLTTWDAFQGQVTPCQQSVDAYKSSRDIGHIQNANTHADNLLSYIRPYHIPSRHVGRVLQQAVKAYATSIEQYGESFRTDAISILEEIKKHNSNSLGLFSEIQEKKSTIDQFHEELFNTEEGIKTKVENFLQDMQEKSSALAVYYNETFIGTDEKPAISKEISKAKELVIEDQKKTRLLFEKSTEENDKLSEFFAKIFGRKTESGEESGLSKQIDEKVQALSDFEDKQFIKYNALNGQIESLLPGATSAGLASAYNEMKNSFTGPIKTASLIFYIAIGILITGAFLSTVESIGFWSINFVKLGDWDMTLKSLAYKIPFYAPVLWLAFYASKRRSEYQRLQQEYAHKEALAKSYNNYKTQIVELDSEDIEMQKMFITKAIDAISYNASATLDGKHGDKMPAHDLAEKFLEKFDSEQLTEFLKIFKKS